MSQRGGSKTMRAWNRAQRVDVVRTLLLERPGASVHEVGAALDAHGVGVHVRTVHQLRDEARQLLGLEAPTYGGWATQRAAAELGVGDDGLRRMAAEVGMPDPILTPWGPRWTEGEWRALAGRFEAAVWRRARVWQELGRGNVGRSGVPLPTPAGQDRNGYWWRPHQVIAWRAEHAQRWSAEQVVERLGTTLEEAHARGDFPAAVEDGQWYAHEVRTWHAHHPVPPTAGMLTLRQLAERMGIRYDYARRLRSQGKLPAPDGWLGKRPRWR